MLSIAHAAKRASINVGALVALIIFSTILCPVLAKASNIELLNDCYNGISPRVYTFHCQQTGNHFDSTEASSTYVIAAAGDFLDPVQLDIFAADLSTGVLLSGIGVTGSSGAISDASGGPDRVPEPSMLTLVCIGLVAGLGIHLRKTTSRNTPFAPEP